MQSIGERLEEARKRKGISIREAAEATKIRGDYLHKFESNQFDIKLPEIYVRGFLRTYANYLKIPSEKIVADYNGLGLTESGKTARQLNREVYGRMDLSVASKSEKDGAETAAPVATDTAPAAEGGTRNPATFVPRPAAGGRGLNIDRDLLIKAGILVVGVLILVVLVVWLFNDSEGPKPRTSPATTSTPSEVWIKPAPGDRTLGLISSAPASVTVLQPGQAGTTVLFRGSVVPGSTYLVPRKGLLRVTSDSPQSVVLEIEGKTYPFPKDPRSGQFLTEAQIVAPPGN